MLKHKTPRSRAYLAWLRLQPCIGCKRTPAGVAAHVRMGNNSGVGMKPSDLRAVPMCNVCHHDQHQFGEPDFWRDLGKDPDRVALRLLARYAVDRGHGKAALAAMEAALVEAET